MNGPAPRILRSPAAAGTRKACTRTTRRTAPRISGNPLADTSGKRTETAASDASDTRSHRYCGRAPRGKSRQRTPGREAKNHPRTEGCERRREEQAEHHRSRPPRHGVHARPPGGYVQRDHLGPHDLVERPHAHRAAHVADEDAGQSDDEVPFRVWGRYRGVVGHCVEEEAEGGAEEAPDERHAAAWVVGGGAVGWWWASQLAVSMANKRGGHRWHPLPPQLAPSRTRHARDEITAIRGCNR